MADEVVQAQPSFPNRVAAILTHETGMEQRSAPAADAAVLFLLSPGCGGGTEGRGPCLILNRRSRHVRQPGDLCCPGGRVQLPLDRWGGRLLRLPGTPLTRWSGWPRWRRRKGMEQLALLLAAGLREAAEEMRLNPFGVRFLGPLPPQPLVIFRRLIAPLVCWVARQHRFFPNWEVERVVFIPLDALLRVENYARFRLEMSAADESKIIRDFPCFLLSRGTGRELLWGATFRIVMDFLAAVYGFQPPAPESRPTIQGRLAASYVGGKRR